MIKIKLFTIGSAIAVVGCTSIPESDTYSPYPELTKEQIRQNVELVFGTTFSSDQSWSSTTRKTVSITADAALADIVKVQILTESPFMNPYARVLTEAEAQKGQTVEFTLDCPDHCTTLYAACVDSKGARYARSFDASQSRFSFAQAATRADDGELKAAYGFPNLGDIKLEMKNASLTYGALRTIKASEGIATYTSGGNTFDLTMWKNAGWQNEREWRASDNRNLGSWYVDAQTVRHNVGQISESQRSELKDVFTNFLGRTDNTQRWGRRDNMDVIRKNAMFQWNNYLVSKGEPITLTLVQMASSEAKNCQVLYYYYNPTDITGMTTSQEVQYLKILPKFRAISCYHTGAAAGINTNYGDEKFFKVHENLLPYYGDNLLEGAVTLSGFKPDPQVYRIRNGAKLDGDDYYMTFSQDNSANGKRLTKKMADDDLNVDYQLWQVFRNDNNDVYLFNIGAQCFFRFDPSGDTRYCYTTYFTPMDCVGPDCYPLHVNGNYLMRTHTLTHLCLGSDLKSGGNYGIWGDKKPDNANSEWFFEPYANSSAKAVAMKKEVKQVSAYQITAKNYAIPEGYRVGFVLKKRSAKAEDCYNYFTQNSWGIANNGELYGDGRLNTEINQYGNHFTSASNYFTMKADDPRIAIFKANNRTYLTFEDGSDAQFSDLIVEVSGAEAAQQTEPLSTAAYTFCFEDRQDGDYDLNDVVIKAERVDRNHVKYSLEACGAHDELYLRNINGKVLNGYVEIHELFGVDANTFVNTQDGKRIDPIQETVWVPEDFSFTNLEQQVYIYNATTQREIKLSKTGEDPHAIMIPYDYEYPLEQVCVKDAYSKFIDWGTNPSADNRNWYMSGIEGKVYTKSQLE